MQFSETDLNIILAATGEKITITDTNGSKSIIGKFRKNYQSVSPYESNVGLLMPVFTCKTSDIIGVSTAAVFRVRGIDYRLDGKPEDIPTGMTLVKLGLKK